MEDKKTSWIYRVLRRLVRMFAPKFRIVGAENLPEEPCVIVGNHSQMYGPIAGELYTPGRHYIWCAGEMMQWREVHGYAYRDFWSGKPRGLRWVYRLLSYLITPLSICLFRNAHTVAVYHDARLLSTFRESMERLDEGCSMVIFPECYEEHNNIVHAFQEKFVDLARFYYKKTGKALLFVPVYIAPVRAEMHFGRGLRFDPSAPAARERRRISEALMDEITELAAALPEHRVVPYPNLPKRAHPKNIPVEVSCHEKANA